MRAGGVYLGQLRRHAPREVLESRLGPTLSGAQLLVGASNVHVPRPERLLLWHIPHRDTSQITSLTTSLTMSRHRLRGHKFPNQATATRTITALHYVARAACCDDERQLVPGLTAEFNSADPPAFNAQTGANTSLVCN